MFVETVPVMNVEDVGILIIMKYKKIIDQHLESFLMLQGTKALFSLVFPVLTLREVITGRISVPRAFIYRLNVGVMFDAFIHRIFPCIQNSWQDDRYLMKEFCLSIASLITLFSSNHLFACLFVPGPNLN